MWKLALFHTVHPRERRAASQLPLELLEGSRGTFRQDLHVSVRQVPGDPREAQASRGPADEPPVPYPLHHAMDEEPGPRQCDLYEAFERRRAQTI